MESPFTLEILGNSHFRLRREGENLRRNFSSVKEALDYVKKVSDSEDDEAVHFERRWDDHHRLLGGLEIPSLFTGPPAFTTPTRTPDYEFVEQRWP